MRLFRKDFRYITQLPLWLFAALVLILVLPSCASQKTIINGLEEREANEIIVFLASKNIEATKVKTKSDTPGGGGAASLYDIAVASDKATEAMAILNANGLPRRRAQNLLELFTASGLVTSDMQQKIRYQAGLAEQIASTIRKIDGILDADIQLSFPEEDPLNPNKLKGAVTASVFVKHQGVLDDPNSHLITKIRRLVASSVQGLSFDNVTVIADRARFSEATPIQAASPSNVELVKVWGVVVARQSVGYFQTIFFIFVALLAVFVLLTIWLLYKAIPVARHTGGIRFLFSTHPLVAEEPTTVETEEESTGKPEDKGKPGSPPPPSVQENVEST